jgi:hypothetical protein
MATWNNRVSVKHLLTEDEDYDSVNSSMTAIANVLQESRLFPESLVAKFRKVPEDDDLLSPVDYANILLSRMYDHADRNRIWIE